MENWVITDCGKVIDIDGVNGLNWNYILDNVFTRERISRFNIDKSKFNRKYPTLESVDNAIAEQYPAMMLESGVYADWYVLNRVEYSPNKIKIESEEFKLNVPNSAWMKLDVSEELLNTVDYESLLKDLEYYNKKQLVKPLTNDLYLIAFYDIWCILYRFKKIRGNVKVEACLLRNNYSNCKNIRAMTYAKNILKKEFIFSSMTGKKSYSLMSASLMVSKGWLELGHLFTVNRDKMIKSNNYYQQNRKQKKFA